MPQSMARVLLRPVCLFANGAAMNWDRIKGNWKQWKGQAKEQWGKITDDDLERIDGKRDQLAGKIQEAYGIGKEEAERQLKDWENRLDQRTGTTTKPGTGERRSG
jgi:uncharacterized protein YjbJ (UPF0337 family)